MARQSVTLAALVGDGGMACAQSETARAAAQHELEVESGDGCVHVSAQAPRVVMDARGFARSAAGSEGTMVATASGTT